MPLERDITTQILNWLKLQPGCFARKAHGSAYGSGWPDIIGCWHGRTFVLEVKRPGEPHQLTLNQTVALRQWERAGSLVGVVHSLDEARQLLSEKPAGTSRESVPPPLLVLPCLT